MDELKVAILQSSYIPWKGYFDIIHDVDLFIFFDDVQFTKRDWRSRNMIITKNGLMWLSVPVLSKGKYEQRICDVEIDPSQKWQKAHFSSITHNYSNAPFFSLYKDFFRQVYLEMRWSNLSELNQYLIKAISLDYLGIKTKFGNSSDYDVCGEKHERLLNLVKATGADIYVSGPSAKNYVIEKDYEEAGTEIYWKDYSDYPKYRQLHGEFNHNVSILDLLFNTGKGASHYIWGWRKEDLRHDIKER